MRVAIIFDDVNGRPDASADERGVLEAVAGVSAALHTLGHEAREIPVDRPDGAWLEALDRLAPLIVFNLCEGVGGHSENEAFVAAAVERMGFPLTGSSAATLELARRKDRVNALLAAAEIPVPTWVAVEDQEPTPAWADYPAIVKPAGEDGSVGISQASVARTATQLAAVVARARAHGTLLVQHFVTGPELNVGVVGETVLPMAEIDFGGLPRGLWPMVSYRAKWEAGSDEDVGTAPRCPAPLHPDTARRAADLARRTWQCIGGQGYGRVDLRADSSGALFVLEVNPNPDLAPHAGLARMAAAAGWTYVELVQRILQEAGT